MSMQDGDVRPGDLWLVDLGVPLGSQTGFRRAALVVGDRRLSGSLALVCPLTTTRRDYPWRIEIAADDRSGLRETSYVQCEHLRSVATARFIHRLGVAGLPTWHAVRQTLRRLLDL